MAIRKPLSVDEVINRGGNVSADKAEEKKDWKVFGLRLRKDLEDEIEGCLESRIGISKTGWILEAIQEKLKREKGQ